MTEDTTLAILYRGPLASCNYGCEYCPFAKRVDNRAQLAVDAAQLGRFIDWVGDRRAPTSVLFTPWGEALIRAPYRDALTRLTHTPHVTRAAIQTNLSGDIAWTHDCRRERLGIWATYHPDWCQRDAFVAKVRALHESGVQVSAGVVGMREHFPAIAALRAELPPRVYLWVNAYKRRPDYYQAEDVARLQAIDPLFAVNNRYHPSRGQACRTGHTVISVDGAGDVRRCHFVPAVLGNIYQSDFDQLLRRRPCVRDTCGCHIGYVHLDYLQLDQVFGAGVLERVPRRARSRLPVYRVPVTPAR